MLGGKSQGGSQGSAAVAAENEASDGAAEAQSTGQGRLYSKDDISTQKQFANPGMAYARDVEVTNGRWAMLGCESSL